MQNGSRERHVRVTRILDAASPLIRSRYFDAAVQTRMYLRISSG
ncbi:hypothetical protein IEO21_09155 [Rhodonia placenta]|uniref:Uncharacterized protein n=1 Tax=Rhodonia placenta TaxID=104341 RepID=A0A8H7NUU1_9APHY|nr:hypothetical protein IEO21_09155 [Postia placenta]